MSPAFPVTSPLTVPNISREEFLSEMRRPSSIHGQSSRLRYTDKLCSLNFIYIYILLYIYIYIYIYIVFKEEGSMIQERHKENVTQNSIGLLSDTSNVCVSSPRCRVR